MPIETTILQADTSNQIDVVAGEGSVIVDETINNGSDELHANYSGTGFLDVNGELGPKATFTFEVTELEPFEITVRYANGSGTPRRISLTADNSALVEGTATDTDTGDWFIWETVTFTVIPVAVGIHKFTINQDETGAPNIDAVAIHDVDVVPNFADPVITTTSFDAVENGTAVGTVLATDPEVDGGTGQTLTYSVTGGADGSLFSITDDGVLTFVDPPHFEANASAAGTIITK